MIVTSIASANRWNLKHGILSMELNLDIDPLRLPEEWLGQAKLFHHFAMLSADADAAVDQAKLTLKVVEGELEMAIRAKPAAYKLIKATEAEVKAAIPTQPQFKEASKRYIEARRNAAYADAAVQAIETRKRALENLVELLRMDYFADPRSSRREPTREDTERNRRISSRLQRKRTEAEASDE